MRISAASAMQCCRHASWEFAVLGINSAPDCIISFMPTTVSQTPTDRPALRASGLHKVYASVTALDGVSFTVNRGEIVGLLGPNGAGKTTTINMVLGVLAATTGRVEIDGIDISKQRARALARTNFAAVYAALPGNLTVIENLRFFGLLYGIRPLRVRVEELLQEFLDAHPQGSDAIEQPEKAQVLDHRQVAGQRRVNGGKIGPCQRSRPLLRNIDPVDFDAAGGRRE